jgi:hypothetical protein
MSPAGVGRWASRARARTPASPRGASSPAESRFVIDRPRARAPRRPGW